MLRHYYLLHSIVEELRTLRGFWLTECFTQDKGVLMMCFESSSGTPREVFLEISTEVQNLAFFLRPTFHRARKNTRTLFSSLIGQTLYDVALAQNERLITLTFGAKGSAGTLHCLLFGGSNAAGYAAGGNVLLVPSVAEGSSIPILEAFKSPEQLVGKPLYISSSSALPLDNYPPQTTLLAALSQCDILLGKLYATEVLWRFVEAQYNRYDNKRGNGEHEAEHEPVHHETLRREVIPYERLASMTLAEARLLGIVPEIKHLAETLRSECLRSTTIALYRYYSTQKKGSILVPSLVPLHRATLGQDRVRKSPAMSQTTLSCVVNHMSHHHAENVWAQPEATFSSASEAVRHCRASYYKEQTFRHSYASIQQALEKRRDKVGRTLLHLHNDAASAKQAAHRQYHAEVLIAQPALDRKGLSEVVVQGWTGEMVRIPLNPALSLKENAELLFSKARESRQAQTHREERTRLLEREASNLDTVLLALAAVHTIQALRSFAAQYRMTITDKHTRAVFDEVAGTSAVAHHPASAALEHSSRSLSKKSAKSSGKEQYRQQNTQQPVKKFREFTLPEGYVLLVGKTAADNDELTVRVAKPHDYWFHARGVAGSHVVLRSPQKDKKPPKYIVEQAAAIAAYYSKARNASLTPVAYTQRKYVRKPKGAAVGAVLMEREDVIMVRPRLPDNTAEE
jgi:hypothetical protein